MKTAIASFLFISASLAVPAQAADIPVKAPVAAAPVFSWTGCYIGTNSGGGVTEKSLSDSVSFAPLVANYGTHSGGGYVTGVQIGCDYQSGPFVFGIRGMGDWSNIRYHHDMNPSGPGFVADVRLRWFATATGRIGYTIHPQLLLYVDGGGAWTRDKINVFQPGGALSESASFNNSGWVVGGGFEVMLLPNLTFFAEYNRLDFGTTRECFTAAPGVVFGGIPCPGGGGNHMDIRQHVDVVMGGFNWRFTAGGGLPFFGR